MKDMRRERMRGPEVTEELFNKVKILKEVGGLSRQEIAKKSGHQNQL